MPGARRLNHVHILVGDIERSVDFYTEVFGLKAMYSDEHNGELLTFMWTSDGDVLTLHAAREGAGKMGGFQHFGFQWDGTLDQALEAVIVGGGKFLSKAGWEPDHVAYVADPDGYVIEIDARPR